MFGEGMRGVKGTKGLSGPNSQTTNSQLEPENRIFA